MKDISLEEMQKMEFDILCFIKEKCDKNHLIYYLAYGTLIGAVRHKGFIPWDDDLDIFMPREDYDKFVEICRTEETGHYKLISYEIDKNFTAPLPKVVDDRTLLIQHYNFIEKVPLGVYVDIFILDGVGNNYQDAVNNYEKSFKNYRAWRKADLPMFSKGNSKLHDILRFVRNIKYKVHGIQYYLQKLSLYNSKMSFYDNRYVASLESGTTEARKEIYLYSDLGDGILWEFNGEKFRIPTNYDKVLRQYYGDYMQLPPEDQRVSNHSYTLTWKDDNENSNACIWHTP